MLAIELGYLAGLEKAAAGIPPVVPWAATTLSGPKTAAGRNFLSRLPSRLNKSTTAPITPAKHVVDVKSDKALSYLAERIKAQRMLV